MIYLTQKDNSTYDITFYTYQLDNKLNSNILMLDQLSESMTTELIYDQELYGIKIDNLLDAYEIIQDFSNIYEKQIGPKENTYIKLEPIKS